MSRSNKVLIVDDDVFLLGLYRKKFEQNECEVDVASSTADALSKLRNGAEPDIIVLDIIMPGMDGIELLKIVREENLAKEAIVVMLTNESDSARIQEARELKADGYIIKASSVPSDVADEVLKIAAKKNK